MQTATQTAFEYSATAGACFPDLDLDDNGVGEFNRWGWKIGPLHENATYVFDLYAGAG